MVRFNHVLHLFMFMQETWMGKAWQMCNRSERNRERASLFQQNSFSTYEIRHWRVRYLYIFIFWVVCSFLFQFYFGSKNEIIHAFNNRNKLVPSIKTLTILIYIYCCIVTIHEVELKCKWNSYGWSLIANFSKS